VRTQRAPGSDRERDGGHRHAVRRLPGVVSIVGSEGVPEAVQLAPDGLDVRPGGRPAILRVPDQTGPGPGV
jgi:hypothetical protein